MLTSQPPPFVIGRFLMVLLIPLMNPASAMAHDFGVTPGKVVLNGTNVQVTLDLHPMDLIQNVLAEESGRERFVDAGELRRHAALIRGYVGPRVRLTADDSPIVLTTDPAWPPGDLAMTRIDSAGKEVGAYLPLTLSGKIPAEATHLEMTFLLFGEGEFVPLFDITITDLEGRTVRAEFLKVNQSVRIEMEPFRTHSGGGKSLLEIILDFARLGFTHILPLGLDHILFVLGIFLLGGGWRPLIKQITAFTLAHSLTLALAMTNLIRLPSRVVEPIIALSISYVALENLFRRDVDRRRWLVVFGFGLVHGLGFAGVLDELGIPPGQFLPALISFNVGVEGGQLAVLALAALATWPIRDRNWYRPWIVRPACLLIAAVGLFWAVERVLG